MTDTKSSELDAVLASLTSIANTNTALNVVLASILAAIIACTAVVTSFSGKFTSVTASQTVSPSITTVGQVISQANANRKGFTLYNNSANSVYVTYGASGTSASPSLIIATFAHFTHFGMPYYTGPIYGIRNAGSGAVVITEFQ